MATYETGATTHQANNLVLSVMNDGAAYQDRLHAGFAILQGANHRVSFRDIVTAEANRQRRQGCTFKPQHITEASKLVQAQTIEHCLVLICDNYDSTRKVEVTGRKWCDNVCGNTYFSCWMMIPQKDGVEYRCIAVPFQYGYDEQWQHEAIRTLRAIGLFADLEYRTTARYEYPINFLFEGVMRKKDMHGGIYIQAKEEQS